MRKLLIAATTAVILASPAFAGTITISYEGDDGNSQVVSYDDTTGMATAGDRLSPYTWDAEASSICVTTPDREICITFEDANAEPSVGDVSRYETNTGAAGTATITAMTD